MYVVTEEGKRAAAEEMKPKPSVPLEEFRERGRRAAKIRWRK
jgi:hypothetical protein